MWASRARYHLFKNFVMDIRQQWDLLDLLEASDLVLTEISALRTLVQDFVVMTRPKQKSAAYADTSIPAFSITIHMFHRILHAFPFLGSLMLKSINIVSPESTWPSEELSVLPRHLRCLELSCTNSTPEDLLLILRMFSSISTLSLNAHVVRWFPQRRTLAAALDLECFDPALLPLALQVSTLRLKGNIAWTAAMCLRLGSSLGLEHLSVVPQELPVDIPALNAMLAGTAQGPRLKTLSIYLNEIFTSIHNPYGPSTPLPTLAFDACTALHTLSLSSLVLTRDYEPVSPTVARCMHAFLSVPAPAVATVVLCVVLRPLMRLRASDVHYPVWDDFAAALAAWPALETVVIKVSCGAARDALDEEATVQALEQRLPLLHGQGKLKVVLVGDP
ncbi:hypothetical protein PsYK624_141080 [Phanerochaete sordida]|uniref:F-box domain-containing protein n=1 Tax=Phanerochaete sordida TaxID=48140 RepID=A0A9P3LJU8_9APHY|nr:hypothetical protein PsYK624_141080 [Phanerochaete sordida]